MAQNPSDDFINFLTVPTLEEMSIVVIVNRLWHLTDVSDDLKHYLYHPNERYKCKDDCVCDIVKLVIEKIPKIPMPKPILDKISNAVRPMGIQILNWAIENCAGPASLREKYPILWTGHGILDGGRTVEAKLYTRNPYVKIENVYNRACTFCSEDIIRNLWGKMSVRMKESVFYRKSIYERHQYYLIAYWTCRINSFDLRHKLRSAKSYNYHDVFDMKHSVTRNMLSLSMLYSNSLAFKHFWHRLSADEERRCFGKYIRDILQYRRYVGGEFYQDTNHYTEMLLFLLTKSKDKEMQSLVFENESDLVLEALFTDWPWQKFLLPTIKEMWGYLDERIYVRLVSKIIQELEPERTAEHFLEDLWCRSPERFQDCFIRNIITNFNQGKNGIWVLLRHVNGPEFRKSLLDNLTDDEKKGILLSTLQDIDQMRSFALTGSLDLVDKLIAETSLTENEINALKYDAVDRCWVRLCHICVYSNSWKQINDFLTWGFPSQEQMDRFKNIPRNLIPVLNSLVFLDEPEIVEELMIWCCNSKEEINQFKKEYRNRVLKIVTTFGEQDWVRFGEISQSSQCVYSDVDVDRFKEKVVEYENIKDDVMTHHYDFEFMQPLLSKFLENDEEIKQLKGKLMLSKEGIEILRKYVTFDVMHVIANELPEIFVGKRKIN